MTEDNKVLKCRVCGKQDATVKTRDCIYTLEVHGVHQPEIICNECEHEHFMDT